MFTVRQFGTESAIKCGGRNAVVRTVLPYVTTQLSGFGAAYIHAFTVALMDTAAVHLFEVSPSLRRSLFDLLLHEQQATLKSVLRELYRDADANDEDSSYQACVNREVRRTMATLHFQLTGEDISPAKELIPA